MLSSAQPAVVDAAIAELEYHERLLAALGLDRSHKIVLHVGSGAADPAAARARFAAAFDRLSDGARERLVLENDERWPLDRVLELAGPLGRSRRLRRVPSLARAVVRRRRRPGRRPRRRRDVARRATAVRRCTSRRRSPASGRARTHETIDLDAFAAFASEVGDLPLDCVLEVKDKEQSVLRARELLLTRA